MAVLRYPPQHAPKFLEVAIFIPVHDKVSRPCKPVRLYVYVDEYNTGLLVIYGQRDAGISVSLGVIPVPCTPAASIFFEVPSELPVIIDKVSPFRMRLQRQAARRTILFEQLIDERSRVVSFKLDNGIHALFQS